MHFNTTYAYAFVICLLDSQQSTSSHASGSTVVDRILTMLEENVFLLAVLALLLTVSTVAYLASCRVEASRKAVAIRRLRSDYAASINSGAERSFITFEP